MTDDYDPDELPEEMRRRLDETLPLLLCEAVADVAGLTWSLVEEDGDPVLRTEPRDTGYERRTNIVGLVADALLARALLDSAGSVPFDLSPERIVELLNTDGFGMRPELPSPDFENDPTDFVPTFQLFVQGPDPNEFASLSEPNWNEVGRWHEIPLLPWGITEGPAD